MTYLNKKAKEIYKVKDAEYIKWCKLNKRKLKSKESKRDFIKTLGITGD